MTTEIAAVTFDCGQAADLARFWSALLDEPLDDGASAFFATIGYRRPQPLRPALMFIAVPEEKTAKNRLHLDLATSDLGAETQRVVDLGATHLGDFDEHGTRWATFRDPEGNEFDIAAQG